jgi:hypothetical protein
MQAPHTKTNTDGLQTLDTWQAYFHNPEPKTLGMYAYLEDPLYRDLKDHTYALGPVSMPSRTSAN